MSVSRVAGVGLNVTDLERSAAFYTGCLGLKEVMRVPPGGPTREIVLSLSGTVDGTLVVLAKLDDAPLGAGRGGFGRVIMNASDAAAVAARARAAGFDVEQMEAPADGPIVFLAQDPDGYQVELYQAPQQA